MKFPRLSVDSFSLSANADVDAAAVSANEGLTESEVDAVNDDLLELPPQSGIPEEHLRFLDRMESPASDLNGVSSESDFPSVVMDDTLPPLEVVSDAEAERLLTAQGTGDDSFVSDTNASDADHSPSTADTSDTLTDSAADADNSNTPAPADSPTVPRKAKIARRRMLDLAQDMARRHNEFLDLFRGDYALSSWASSLIINALVIGTFVLLALLYEKVETHHPPLSIIAGVEQDGVETTGEMLLDELPDLQLDADAFPAPSFNGGAWHSNRPDMSSLLGNGGSPNPGAGAGTGTGDGVGAGAEIAKRVEAAGGKVGKMRVAIAWDNVNDLDLHLITPRDERIFFGRMLASCGGVLDVDKNAQPPLTSEAAENIRWLDDVPRDGTYTVQVHFYGVHGGPQRTAYSVLLEAGTETHLFKGMVTPGRLMTVVTFTIQDGKFGKIASKLKETDEGELVAGPQLADKNMANRERFAKEALDEALKTTKPSILIGRLKRIMQTYAGTAAAAEAKKKLDELANTPD